MMQIVSLQAKSPAESKMVYHPETALNACLTYSPLLAKPFFGLNIDYIHYPVKHFGTGLSFMVASRKMKDTFSYSIKQPIINYFEIGWINQFNCIHTKRFRLNVELVNGIATAQLGDFAVKEKYWTKYGYRYRTKKVANNTYYYLSPGMDFSLRLVSENHGSAIYLTAKANYSFLFGRSHFASANQFSNYNAAIGISIIGLLSAPVVHH